MVDIFTISPYTPLMITAYISHPECLLHDMGTFHPEAPARMRAIHQALLDAGLMSSLISYEAPAATREQLGHVHDENYIDYIFKHAPTKGNFVLDPDTLMNPHSLSAALYAAGAAVLAVDLLMQQQAQSAFCNIRPPGHHAEKKRAMGFCFFNNVAVGAAYAIQQYHLQRIAIVDFDVHHGNGTEDIFAGNEKVLLCSSFQHPFYPLTQVPSPYANILKIPLTAGSDGHTFRILIEQHCLPALHEFKPELIFFSAGFDAHRADPLANIALTETDYAWITQEVKQIAQQYAAGRMISCLEGGYDLTTLGQSAVAHIQALL